MQLSGTSSKREGTEKVKTLETLEEKSADIQQKWKKNEETRQETIQTLESNRHSIKQVFDKVGCRVDAATPSPSRTRCSAMLPSRTARTGS